MFHVHQPVVRLAGWPAVHPCPACGHCPTCGRGGGHVHQPIVPYQPPIVIYPPPVIYGAGPTPNTNQAINRLAGRTAA